MKPESRQFIHMGINYVIAPPLEIDREGGLKFQQSLIAAGIDFTHFSQEGNQIKIGRNPPFPIEILVAGKSVQPQPFGQIVVIAPNPNRPLNTFAQEVESILQAFNETWPSPNRQVVSCDVTLRCLYSSTRNHAFEEIWEDRLGQPADLLNQFGRPVLGGGLRFVMPPQKDDPDPSQVEVKIESFLNDVTKIFIETQFAWPIPKPPGVEFCPEESLRQVDDFIKNKAQPFITEGQR